MYIITPAGSSELVLSVRPFKNGFDQTVTPSILVGSSFLPGSEKVFLRILPLTQMTNPLDCVTTDVCIRHTLAIFKYI